MHDTLKSVREEALQAAKLAVRAYARDPSRENEAGVEEAFRRIRRLNAVARWRRGIPRDQLRLSTSKRRISVVASLSGVEGLDSSADRSKLGTSGAKKSLRPN